MIHQSSDQPPAQLPSRPKWRERFLIGLAVILIAGFYLWTVAPVSFAGLISKDDLSYNNLLVRGLCKGQLSLDVPADPFLATLADPYNPANRAGHGLHDASYYQGKYYIYFGITPVLILYLPFHLLTGYYISDELAVVVFSLAGFLTALALLRSIANHCFPRAPLSVHLACVGALGLANMVPPLLRRPQMWEVPISCAYALFMVVLFCTWKAMARAKLDLRWVAGASLVMGLCVGARPVYLFASVVLFAPLVWWAVQGGWGWRLWREPKWRQMLLAVALPIMCVGVGLATYNYLRFGSPTEFGQTYQLSGAEEGKLDHFSLRYFLFNIKVYFFSLPGVSPYFPFLTVIHPPAVPPGQFGMENPYGIIPGMPWVLLSLAVVGLALSRRDALGFWAPFCLAGVALTCGVICCFGGNTGRYQVDFTPGLILLGAVGALWLGEKLSGSRWKMLGVGGLLALCTWSVGFNILISLQHNRLLMVRYPQIYDRVATAFNYIPHWTAKVIGHKDGPVVMKVVFPPKKTVEIEPLVTTGHEFLADYIFVHYLDSGQIRFGWEHTSQGSFVGTPVSIDRGAEHTLVVQMGSLYPPAAHPYYAGLAPEITDQLTRQVRVTLNGRTVLNETLPCYDASDWQPSIGTSGPSRPGFKRDFSGKILSWKREPSLRYFQAQQATGSLHLKLKLPPFTRVRSEPLVSSGETGKGDLIYIRYIDKNHIQFGHDHWGSGGLQSPVIEYDPSGPVDIDIFSPPLLQKEGEQRVVVLVNGQEAMAARADFYPSRTTQIAVGRNYIGASSAEAEFTGTIELQERVAR